MTITGTILIEAAGWLALAGAITLAAWLSRLVRRREARARSRLPIRDLLH